MTKKQPNKKAIVITRIVYTILTLAAIAAIFFFIRSIVDKRILIDRGEQAIGIVTSLETDNHVSRSGSMTTRTLNYSFTPQGSTREVVEEDFVVSKKEYEKYPQDSQIPITYLAGDSSMSAPTVSLRHMHPQSALFMYLIGISCALILTSKVNGLLRAKYKINKPGLANYLLSTGMFVMAVIIGMGIVVGTSILVSLILS
jgi:hypothetical protein